MPFRAALLLPLCLSLPGQTPAQKALVAAERAFAALAVEKGTGPAFTAFLAPDAVLLKPQPLPARPLYEKRADDGTRLAWEPDFAELAGSGELGWTTGPWRWRRSAAEPPSAHGHFVSIWRRQPDGAWKVALDLGVSHPEQPAPTLRVAPASSAPPLAAPALEAARRDFLEAQAAFAREAAQGHAEALSRWGAEDLRVFREGQAPGGAALAAKALLSSVETKDHGLSRAGDLAYVYGLARTAEAPGAEGRPCSTLHIWRRAKAGWQVAADILLPF